MAHALWAFLLLAGVSASAFGLDLDAAADGLRAQSPKVSPSGKHIAYLLIDAGNHQRIEVRSSTTADAAAAIYEFKPGQSSAYWLNWIDDDQLDVSVSEGEAEQILRWTLSTNSISRLLPEGTGVVLAVAIPFNNFASPIYRYVHDKHTLTYDTHSGAIAESQRNLVPARCTGDGERVLRMYGRPEQLTWELKSPNSSEPLWRLDVSPPDRRQGTALMSISSDGCVADFMDSVGRDALALRRLDLRTGAYLNKFESEQDPAYVSVDRRSDVVDAVGFEVPIPHAVGLSERAKSVLQKIAARFPNGYYVLDRSIQDRYWLVRHGDEVCRPMWSVIDTASGAELLSTTEPTVKWKAHCQRRVLFVERPGEPRIEAIVTSPGARNCTKTTCDLVLVLHGGPGVRDRFRADAFVSELSASGYLVLNVNFRGSAGFGKAFESLDVGSWGTDIPGDVYAAVNRLSAEGYRVGKKISFGSSFGGYLSLLAATRDQEVDCAIAHSATPDLMSFINSRAKSTEGHTDLLARVGDPRNPEQLEQINRISPLSFADRGKVPILLVNGASDSIAPPQNVEGFANVRSRRAPLSTFTFDREGHDINEPSSRHIFFSVVAEFMQRCSNPQHNAPLPRPPLSVVHYSDGIGLIRND